MLSDDQPFVLLDDARQGGSATLYRSPAEIIEVRDPADLDRAFEWLREGTSGGLHAAGFLSYETGLLLEPKLAPLCRRAAREDPPLLWLGLFEAPEAIDANAVLPPPESAWTSPARPLVDRAAYEAAVERVLEHIRAGDIYQANLTFPAEVQIEGHPLAAYARLRKRARSGYGGIVFTGKHWLLSLSPELFFTLGGGRITTRPMKGTAERGRDLAADQEAIRSLREDPKQKAENLMIVDLLRNDLSRVSKPGTVKVPSLFEVETYPTVHQMTSTIIAELEEGADPVEVIRTIFPCGSITGAPKIRAMEIIDALESTPRGVYTGAIGSISPDGSAAFNVAIRTLWLRNGEDRALLGLGSGIVAASRPSDEWRESLAKGAFVAAEAGFDLIETMRFEPHAGIVDLERHLARMKGSAEKFGFAFDRHGARNELQAATFTLREPKMLRLMLSRSGAMAVEARTRPARPEEPVAIALAPLPVPREDFRLRHKTSDRGFYDEARAESNRFEILFEDADGFLTEGSFTNLFVERDGLLLTPPLSRGLLPGVLRGRLIEEGEAQEADLRISDLAGGFLIGNALRGLLRAWLA